MRAYEFITESPSPLGNGHNIKLSKRQKAAKRVEQMHEDEQLDEGWKDALVAGAITLASLGLAGLPIDSIAGMSNAQVQSLAQVQKDPVAQKFISTVGKQYTVIKVQQIHSSAMYFVMASKQANGRKQLSLFVFDTDSYEYKPVPNTALVGEQGMQGVMNAIANDDWSFLDSSKPSGTSSAPVKQSAPVQQQLSAEAIKAKVSRFANPMILSKGDSTVVKVTAPSGDPVVVKSSGNTDKDNAVIRAVMQAQPFNGSGEVEITF